MEQAVIPVEAVACHSRETLRLVQVVRLLDDILRRSPAEAREEVRRKLLSLADHGRDIARKGFLLI